MKIISLLLCLSLFACRVNSESPQSIVVEETSAADSLKMADEKLIISKISEIPTPEGFTRKNYKRGTFAHYVQNLPVKASDYSQTYSKDSVFWASEFIVDKDLLFYGQDLEQCADWAMRLWADYHKQENKLSELFLYNYSGEKIYYKNEGNDYNSFLKKSFSYSNSYSIKKGANEISKANLQPGDLFVQNKDGGIGHVSVILDVAEDNMGNCLYLIGFSYMPAQQMHIDWALEPYGEDGWNSYEGFCKFLQETLPLGEPVLRRF